MRRTWLLAVLIVTVIPSLGCVSITTAPRDRAPSTTAMALEGVPVFDFPPDQCGPGALAAVLIYHGDDLDFDELDRALPRGPRNGVLSIDLLLAARARGFEAQMVRGNAELLRRSIEEGVPAILLLRVVDIPGAKRDYFHYIVVDGYDGDRGLVRLHFGDGNVRWGRLEKLENSWSGTDYATLLVRPGAPVEPSAPRETTEAPGI